MARMPKYACLWPGLPQLWVRGSWSGLGLAAGFAALVNLLLTASWVWTEWFSAEIRLASWVVVVVLWTASAWLSLVRGETDAESAKNDGEPDLFRQAQDHYLAGQWYETESLLNILVRKNVRDVDARLMRATVWRRTERFDEAEEELDQLGRWEAAAKWKEEIARERQWLDLARETKRHDEDTIRQEERPGDEGISLEERPIASHAA